MTAKLRDSMPVMLLLDDSNTGCDPGQVWDWLGELPARVLVAQRDADPVMDGYFPGPTRCAVLRAKYLLTNGGFLRLAYQMRKLPSGNRSTDWLVT